jgi:cold-inducible RNA-binding protein
MSARLFVGNLPFSTSEQDLWDLFQQAGMVVSCDLIIDKVTDKSRGFAFVEMGSREEAREAMSRLNGHQLDRRTLTVNEARPRTERPRVEYAGSGHGAERREVREWQF